MASADDLRQLKIQTGVVKRTTKELTMYKKESATEATKLQQMKDAGVGEAPLSARPGWVPSLVTM